MKAENKTVKNIKYNCKQLFKYVKSKIKIHKNVNTVKNDETGEIMDMPVEKVGVLARFLKFIHSSTSKLFLWRVKRITDELKALEYYDWTKVIKLWSAKFDARKIMGPDEIHPKILKYLSSNKSLINTISKLFEKYIEYEKISFIWKMAIVIPLHKKVWYGKTCILCKVF